MAQLSQDCFAHGGRLMTTAEALERIAAVAVPLTEVERVGLRAAKAGGQSYSMASFAPGLRFQIAGLVDPTDGKPIVSRLNAGRMAPRPPRPCGSVIGVRGGKSRGKGSGSRLKRVACGSCGYVARVSTKWLDHAGAPLCPCNQQPMEV